MLSIGANEVVSCYHAIRNSALSNQDFGPEIICTSRHILNTFKTTRPQHDYDHYFVLLRVSY